MSGVVFIICIPTEEHENNFIRNFKKKVRINETSEIIPNLGDSPINKPSKRPQHNKENVNEFGYNSMEKILKNILEKLEITNATWSKGDTDNFVQILFSLDYPNRCEEILEILKENEIGKRYNSSISVIPCTIHYHGNSNIECDSKYFEKASEKSTDKNTAWNQFISSVSARLTVAQIVENVKVHAALTFDFICLILISTLLCAIGLIENSNIYLLSSMLISPMMGPVMAGTFGSVIQDKRLQKIGVQNELIGLGLATLVGFCYGSVICVITDKYGTQDWPTYEMTSRGELRTLWVGCLIALLSGAAVALGILSDNIASLVGVAISTSLMPPAVNAGLLWSMASIYSLKGNETTSYISLTNTTLYSNNKAVELLALGAISICLTFVNIICIYVAGILVFKIKEVAPIGSKYHVRRKFWKHDIKIARDYNKTLQGDEILKLCNTYQDNFDLMHHSTEISTGNYKIKISRPEYTWSHCMGPTKEELNQLYQNMKKDKTTGNKSSDHFKLDKPYSQSYRNVSQIFASPAESESGLEAIKECSNERISIPSTSNSNQSLNARMSHSIFAGNRKFIVTPCESDPLLI